MLRDMRVARLQRAREEIPTLRRLRRRGGVEAAFRVRGRHERAVHDAPFAVREHGVPPVVRVGRAAQREEFPGRFEVPADDFGVQAHGEAHFHRQHRDFFRAATAGLDDAPRVDLAFEVLLPGDFLRDPREDGAEALHVAAVGPADVSLG